MVNLRGIAHVDKVPGDSHGDAVATAQRFRYLVRDFEEAVGGSITICAIASGARQCGIVSGIS